MTSLTYSLELLKSNCSQSILNLKELDPPIFSDTLHIIVVNNSDPKNTRSSNLKQDENRLRIIRLLEKLIDSNYNDHIIVIYLDSNIQVLWEPLNLNYSLISLVEDRIYDEYKRDILLDVDTFMKLLKSELLFEKQEFKFIEKYDKVHTYAFE
jgi:hypothetical protein